MNRIRSARPGAVLLAAAALAAVAVVVAGPGHFTSQAQVPLGTPYEPHVDLSWRSAAHVACAQHPSACAFPDATDTGVVRGTRLLKVPQQISSGKGWTYDDNDGVVVTGKGAVISDLDIENNGIEIKADDVTVSNVRIVETGDWWGIGLYHANHVTIEHTTITSPYSRGAGRLEVGIKDVYGDAVGTRALRDNIAHTSTGVQLSNGLIRSNYIHDPGYKTGDHINGTTSNAGSRYRLVIAHNTIFNTLDQADAISLFEDFGAQHNALITDNLVAGGGYSIYGGANSGGQATRNIRIVGNRFSTVYFRQGGGYGPIAAFDPGGTGNEWSDNRWIDGPNAGRRIGPYGHTVR